jgi:hypothetical protein
MDAAPQSLPSAPLYLLDGEQINLRELLAVNDFGSDVVVQLRNLPPGQSLAIGGATLTRVEASS